MSKDPIAQVDDDDDPVENPEEGAIPPDEEAARKQADAVTREALRVQDLALRQPWRR